MKKAILSFFTLLILISCNNQKPQNMESKNTALVKQYFEHFNNHKWKEISEMYTPTADFKDPSLGTGIVKQTRAETLKKYSELNQMFPDLTDKVIQIYPSGENNVIVEFVSSGTAEDDSTFELPICTIFTIENGLITKDFTYYDNFDE
ncbi:nuclear transport factor 2 family protein [Flavobacterium sp. Fl-318]|uniref:Nuclear transport factor 2 family protein n=1 Tax=Flavobacterium cupriresistens TaxID=2893885 RepID=A0ABU4RAX4_9FLAO|nr:MULTISPECIES: nuclear transport factor 2 family protein [unclassified Flavobacterium]MDX6189737.1 nuclear transport factor 2 family protein [Flavobacterium sp. Fl-318]UFH40856.1 nuclear transport factor 2 family protein [Flavobacterium sp. F-323]